MSIQSMLKGKVKQILINKCGRDYERTYFHALKNAGYSNVIDEVEEKMLLEWGGDSCGESVSSLSVVEYDFTTVTDFVTLSLGTAENLIVFKEKDAALSKHALAVIEKWAFKNPEAMFFYGDEDVICEEGGRVSPWLKPQWSPSLFESVFYIGGVFGIRKQALEGLANCDEKITDFASRVLQNIGGFEKRESGDGGDFLSENVITHIPYVLCHHWDEKAYEAYRIGLAEEKFCKCDTQEKGTITSVIIPSKDHPEVLERNLRALAKTVAESEMEIIVVDNGSSIENKEKIEKLAREFQMKYIYQPMEFHFSKMCNIGATVSTGSYLLFLNDDTEAVFEGWLERMTREASKPFVGAVGLKLLYPDSDKIQHAGIVNLPMGPVHKLQFMSDSDSYYFDRNHITLNVLAVTGACLMVKRERFEEVGGFPEELPVAFNDVDLCFSLYEKGYYNVVVNDLFMYHHESLSRGDDESPEKIKRLERERAKLYERHQGLVAKDPFYHILLNREGLDTRIVPASEEWLSGGSETVWAKEITPMQDMSNDTSVGKVRLHKGLYVRVESVGGNFIQGYSFMAGDDNACFEKKLLLVNEADGKTYEAILSPTLRQDLQDNMPDQKHVAMSGFSANICGLPKGSYRIGIMAFNKVSGITYVNYCARSLSISE